MQKSARKAFMAWSEILTPVSGVGKSVIKDAAAEAAFKSWQP